MNHPQKNAEPAQADKGNELLSSVRTVDERIKALNRERQLRHDDIVERQAALAKIDEHMKDLRTARKILIKDTVSSLDFNPNHLIPLKKKKQSSLAWVVREAAYKVLQTVGHPLNSTELLEEITALGIEIEGDGAAKKINKILWAAKTQFLHVETGYWIAEMPIPDEAGKPRRRKSKPRP